MKRAKVNIMRPTHTTPAENVRTQVAAVAAAKDASAKTGSARLGVVRAHRRRHEQRGRSVVKKPLRILIVEDDRMIGPVLAEMLEDLGHVVCGVEINAENAVAAAARHHPELMIVDIGLGHASGVAAVNEILKSGFVPHVFVTGDVLRHLGLGPNAVLIQKPFRGPDIVAAIERAIRGNRA
jgi:two-component system, response regulator PdtaR